MTSSSFESRPKYSLNAISLKVVGAGSSGSMKAGAVASAVVASMLNGTKRKSVISEKKSEI